jgi:ACS family hexuronate transporter-like MFS transporter
MLKLTGWRYETRLMVILSLTFGIAFFDRNALNYLIPFITQDLKLTNTQIGMLSSALSLSWAISGMVIGAFSDAGGHRKTLLIIAIIVFSFCSVLSGLATTFLMLLAARLIMGISEGPVLPISQSLVALDTPENKRGLYMGVMQNFGSNLLGSFAAPLVVVGLASLYDWRVAFYLAGIPGLIAAFLIFKYVREPKVHAISSQPATTSENIGRWQIIKFRNVFVCILICILMVAYTVIAWTFMPVFYVQFRAFTPGTMSWLMGVLGISATVCSMIVPGLSDRLGRKPILIIFSLIGVVCPLAALYYSGSALFLAALLFVGWSINGNFPLIMATVPSETLPAKYIATAVGLVMGTGEVIGGFSGPILSGWAADNYGLQAPLFIMVGCALAAMLLTFAIQETAPIKLQQAATAKA